MRVPSAGETLGRYRLDRVIGQGGMAVVFAATDLRLERTVAVKVITGALAESEEFRQRFHAEAAALAKLSSPYVTPIHDHDEIDDVLFIVTQYVDGTDLHSMIRTQGSLPPREALSLVAQVARGLGDAHRRGIVHRDVKPSNVLVREPGTPEAHAYLSDFGVARTQRPDGEQLTTPGTVTGTWAYLAPECIQGQPATPASDIYALGCVLYAAVTGSAPYSGTDTQIMVAHVNEPIPQLPGEDAFTTQLNGLFGRLLAKDPAERPSDISQLRTELERLSNSAGSAAPPPPPPPGAPHTHPRTGQPAMPATQPRPADPEPAKGRTRLALLLVAGLVVLAVIGGGATWVVLAGGESPDDPAEADEAVDPQLVTGDANGDGYGDVLVHQERSALGGTPLSLWTVPSTGSAFGTPERTSAEVGKPLPGDVDGDGRADVVWVHESDDVVTTSVTVGEGDPWGQELTMPADADVSWRSALLADVDGDGRDDLILPGGSLGDQDTIQVAVSDGDSFGDVTEWWRSTREDGWFWPGDFDGDGRSDLLHYNTDEDGENIAQLLTADDQQFTEQSESPLPGAPYSPYVAEWLVGDVDGDGVDELVIPKAGRQSIDVLEVTADGLGEPVAWRTWNLDVDDARDKVFNNKNVDWTISDLDGDGQDDLIALREAKDEQMELMVRISEGDAFTKPEVWGSLPCDQECDDTFSFED